MKILNLSLGQDTGGQQMRLARAWQRYFPEDRYISVTSRHTFYEIQHMLEKGQLFNEWWPEADVVHLNNDLMYIARYRELLRMPKPLVIHHHGTMYRTRPEYHLHALRRYNATAICSTVDLWAIAPDETRWLPQAYETEELMGYRNAALVDRPDDGILRIAHAPTHRVIKSTKALIQAVNRLRLLGAKVELDIIEGVSNVQCLERKARADVFVDQLLLGYGCNAVEAWGMGIPVIAGVDPERCGPIIRQQIPADTESRMLEQWGRYPFMEATEETLAAALSRMLKPEVRQQYSAIGTEHFMKHHEAQKVVTTLRGIYLEALDKGPWDKDLHPLRRGR